MKIHVGTQGIRDRGENSCKSFSEVGSRALSQRWHYWFQLSAMVHRRYGRYIFWVKQSKKIILNFPFEITRINIYFLVLKYVII